jgi:hypothetical protein
VGEGHTFATGLSPPFYKILYIGQLRYPRVYNPLRFSTTSLPKSLQSTTLLYNFACKGFAIDLTTRHIVGCKGMNIFFLFVDGSIYSSEKMTGNCIIVRSAWCKASVIFFFFWWIFHPQIKLYFSPNISTNRKTCYMKNYVHR